jgi:hypothetical protein
LSEQFLYKAYLYDDGLMGSDKDLASALWNGFFEANEDNPEKVEKLVHYVRKQVCVVSLLFRLTPFYHKLLQRSVY